MRVTPAGGAEDQDERMLVVIVVAAAENGVIGDRGRIPWRLPEDLRRFKRITTGHVIVMGRKTWETLGRPLPDRENVVVTRQKGYAADGAVVVSSLDEALAHARDRGETEAFVIGGGEIYREALPLAGRVHLTRVHAAPAGDATFPALDPSEWREVAREEREQPATAEAPPLRYSFLTLERRR